MRVCVCASSVCPLSSLPWVLSPPQPLSTFPPLHIPLLTETRSYSFFCFLSVSFFPFRSLTPSFCCVDIFALPLYWDTSLAAPQVTLSTTADLRGKCKVPPHQEIKTLASSRCLTPLTSLVFPSLPLHIQLPKSLCTASCSVVFFLLSPSAYCPLFLFCFILF